MVTRSPMMENGPMVIHCSLNTVPSGNASLVPSPSSPNRYGPGLRLLTAPASCTHRQPRCTARPAARRDLSRTDPSSARTIDMRSPYRPVRSRGGQRDQTHTGR